MRGSLVALFLFSLFAPSYGAEPEYTDPFINVLALLEKKYEKVSKDSGDAGVGVEGEKILASLFSPKLKAPFDSLKIEGVLITKDGAFLVLSDSQGEIYLLREGDAISESEKIEKISQKEVVILSYYETPKGIEVARRVVKLGE
jgi:hypothetical protein